MPVTLSIGTLTDADLAALKAALAGTPTGGGTQPPGNVPPYINPQPGRTPAVTPMPWTPAHDIRPGPKLDDTNIWLIPFTTGAFVSGSFSLGEWQSQPTRRCLRLIRNRDSAVLLVMDGPQTPSFNFIDTPPLPHSGKVQLDHNETYTLAVWNQVTAAGSGTMFVELQFR